MNPKIRALAIIIVILLMANLMKQNLTDGQFVVLAGLQIIAGLVLLLTARKSTHRPES